MLNDAQPPLVGMSAEVLNLNNVRLIVPFFFQPQSVIVASSVWRIPVEFVAKSDVTFIEPMSESISASYLNSLELVVISIATARLL